MRFKIWYGDGSTFSSDEGPWEAAPKENVQVIRSGNQIIKGKNYYDFDGTRFYKSDDTRELPCVSLKYGRWMTPKEEHMKLIKLALDWK